MLRKYEGGIIMSRDFRSLRDDKGLEGARKIFEGICTELFQAKFDKAHGVEVSQGDGGIDIFIGDFNSEIEIYQCKFFVSKIGDSQKNQIRQSFKKVAESKEFTFKKWYLCVAKNLNKNEHKWWAEWKNKMENEYSKEIILYDESKLISELKRFNLYNRAFETITIDRNFFNENSSEARKEEIANALRPLISYIKSNDFTYSTVDIIEIMDDLYYKYDEDIFFSERESNLIEDITKLAQVVSFNTYEGKLRKNKDVVQTIYELRKSILTEYRRIIG
jgi:hypothetical protein